MNLPQLALTGASPLPKVTIEPLDLTDTGLHRSLCTLTYTNQDPVTVMLLANQDLERMRFAGSMTVPVHGFGVTSAITFTDLLEQAVQQSADLVATVELHSAQSVYPNGMQLTPQVLTEILTAVLVNAAPNANNNVLIGNSMGGMFMAGVAVLMERLTQTTSHCIFDNSMSPNITRDPTSIWGVEPKTFLHRALSLLVKYCPPLLLPGLNLLFRIPPIIKWYCLNLFNQATPEQETAVRQLFKTSSSSGQDIFRTLANMAGNAAQWGPYLGRSPVTLPGGAIILQSPDDMVFGHSASPLSLATFFRDFAGNEIEIRESTGAHLPDAQRTRQILEIARELRAR